MKNIKLNTNSFLNTLTDYIFLFLSEHNIPEGISFEIYIKSENLNEAFLIQYKNNQIIKKSIEKLFLRAKLTVLESLQFQIETNYTELQWNKLIEKFPNLISSWTSCWNLKYKFLDFLNKNNKIYCMSKTINDNSILIINF
jgi:hypothetical protein